jgi:hypothetical protein
VTTPEASWARAAIDGDRLHNRRLGPLIGF